MDPSKAEDMESIFAQIELLQNKSVLSVAGTTTTAAKTGASSQHYDDSNENEDVGIPPLRLNVSTVTESMTDAVNAMEEKFKTTDGEIDELNRKLDSEFLDLFNHEPTGNELKNPTKILKRLQEAKAEFSQIKDEALELRKFQQNAVELFQAEFEKLNNALSCLQGKVIPEQPIDEGDREAEKLLTEHMDKLVVTSKPACLGEQRGT